VSQSYLSRDQTCDSTDIKLLNNRTHRKDTVSACCFSIIQLLALQKQQNANRQMAARV